MVKAGRKAGVYLAMVAAAVLLAASGARAQENMGEDGPHWSYSGPTGPEHWGDLSPAYHLCKDGKRQSPINIKGGKQARLNPLKFQYVETPLRIVNTGHSIQVNAPDGGRLSVGGRSYPLVQFHFHHPAEEEISGQGYAMVAHLVHSDVAGHTAVVAILFKEGEENPFIKVLWDHMPAQKGMETVPSGVRIDLSQLLPATLGYYSFSGSLTTPPCSEGLRWYVLNTPVEVSAAQLAAFAKLYPHNVRPIQARNGREILEPLKK